MNCMLTLRVILQAVFLTPFTSILVVVEADKFVHILNIQLMQIRLPPRLTNL